MHKFRSAASRLSRVRATLLNLCYVPKIKKNLSEFFGVYGKTGYFGRIFRFLASSRCLLTHACVLDADNSSRVKYLLRIIQPLP